MKPIATLSLALLITVACNKKEKAPEPTAAPFKGPLTVALLMGANDAVKPSQPWDQAFAVVQAKLGPPTKVDGDKYWWAVMEGDDCAYTMVAKEDGKPYQVNGFVVGMIQPPEKYGKDGAIMNRGQCLELLGKGAVAEDPNAPGPAETNTVKDVLANAVKGRSKWAGKQVKVTGVVKQGGGMVVLADASDDNQTVHAWMKEGAKSPDQGKPTTLTCSVKISKFVTGTGDPGLEAELSDCTL